MPTTLFFDLDISKKNILIHVATSEFSQYGYYNSSTNRIVKSCGISKGSLFNYFPNKEDLYFYILDCITDELMLYFDQRINELPIELFQRIIKYSELEFAWYIKHPEKYNLILHAFTKSDTEIYQKTKTRYSLIEQNTYYKLLEHIDSTQLKWDKSKTLDIMKWFLKGFNEDFINKISMNTDCEIDTMRYLYTKSLTEYMELLKVGLTK